MCVYVCVCACLCELIMALIMTKSKQNSSEAVLLTKALSWLLLKV